MERGREAPPDLSRRGPEPLYVQLGCTSFRNRLTRTVVYAMTSCDIIGFFSIADRIQRRLHRTLDSPEEVDYYLHYLSAISGTRRTLGLVDIRSPSPARLGRLPQNSVVYVAGTIYLQTGLAPSLIDADYMHVVSRRRRASPSPRGYPPARVEGMGRTACEHASHSGSMWAVRVSITQYVRHSVQSFDIVFVPKTKLRLTANLIIV